MEQQRGPKTFKYKLKPAPEQERALDRTLPLRRHVYNAAIGERREAWRMEKEKKAQAAHAVPHGLKPGGLRRATALLCQARQRTAAGDADDPHHNGVNENAG
jgi:hypothetical protein